MNYMIDSGLKRPIGMKMLNASDLINYLHLQERRNKDES